MAYWNFKVLPRRTASDNILSDKAFNIACNPNYGYQGALSLMINEFFNKKSSGSGAKSEIMLSQQVAEEIKQTNN